MSVPVLLANCAATVNGIPAVDAAAMSCITHESAGAGELAQGARQPATTTPHSVCSRHAADEGQHRRGCGGERQQRRFASSIANAQAREQHHRYAAVVVGWSRQSKTEHGGSKDCRIAVSVLTCNMSRSYLCVGGRGFFYCSETNAHPDVAER